MSGKNNKQSTIKQQRLVKQVAKARIKQQLADTEKTRAIVAVQASMSALRHVLLHVAETLKEHDAVERTVKGKQQMMCPQCKVKHPCDTFKRLNSLADDAERIIMSVLQGAESAKRMTHTQEVQQGGEATHDAIVPDADGV